MSLHRIPPDFALRKDPRACMVCGTHPIPKTRRVYCGDGCSELRTYAFHPGWASWRLALDTFGETEKARCFECGMTAREAMDAHDTRVFYVLEFDHIKPLWSLTRDEAKQLRWWLPFNTQLLCHWCHARKTAREARDRALEKRIVSNVALFRRTGIPEDDITAWVARIRTGERPHRALITQRVLLDS